MTVEDMRNAIEGALADVFGDSEFVLKWVAIIESMGSDGERGIYTVASSDVKAHDSMGLLQYGLASEQAVVGMITLSRLTEYGDEE